MFGTSDASGIPHAFHNYSMKQAIQEGFILDVLKNYVTYDTYFKIGKKIADDPCYEKSKANKALGKFLSLHPHNLTQKTQIIIKHFRTVTNWRQDQSNGSDRLTPACSAVLSGVSALHQKDGIRK